MYIFEDKKEIDVFGYKISDIIYSILIAIAVGFLLTILPLITQSTLFLTGIPCIISMAIISFLVTATNDVYTIEFKWLNVIYFTSSAMLFLVYLYFSDDSIYVDLFYGIVYIILGIFYMKLYK